MLGLKNRFSCTQSLLGSPMFWLLKNVIHSAVAKFPTIHIYVYTQSYPKSINTKKNSSKSDSGQ